MSHCVTQTGIWGGGRRQGEAILGGRGDKRSGIWHPDGTYANAVDPLVLNEGTRDTAARRCIVVVPTCCRQVENTSVAGQPCTALQRLCSATVQHCAVQAALCFITAQQNAASYQIKSDTVATVQCCAIWQQVFFPCSACGCPAADLLCHSIPVCTMHYAAMCYFTPVLLCHCVVLCCPAAEAQSFPGNDK